MNKLLLLSRKYARKELALEDYRAERRKLVIEVLSGHHVEHNSITNVPMNELPANEPTEQPKEHRAPLEKQHSVPEIAKKPKSPIGLFALLVLVIAGTAVIAILIKPELLQLLNVNNAGREQASIYPNSNNLGEVDRLTQQWRHIIDKHEITHADKAAIKAQWESMSSNQKLVFEENIKAQLRGWEDDFDKELEVSLTLQLLSEIGLHN